jgi:hypothetical protein
MLRPCAYVQRGKQLPHRLPSCTEEHTGERRSQPTRRADALG